MVARFCLCRILGLGNAADAIEILSIGYILAVYEDKEGTLTRAQQSTTLRCSISFLPMQCSQTRLTKPMRCCFFCFRCIGGGNFCWYVCGRHLLRHPERPNWPPQEFAVLAARECAFRAAVVGVAEYLCAHRVSNVRWSRWVAFSFFAVPVGRIHSHNLTTSPRFTAISTERMAGIGGTVPAMFTLCSEHVPVNRRGFYVTIVASYWMVVGAFPLCLTDNPLAAMCLTHICLLFLTEYIQGSVFTAGLAWFMLGDPESHYSWRAFAAIVSLPAFICWFLTYRYVPESAQYFARRRQFSDAEDVVSQIHFINGNGMFGSDRNAHEATGLLSPFETSTNTQEPSQRFYSASVESDDEAEQKTLAESYRSLFAPILRVTTISLLLSWFCLSFGSYGLATWITVLFKRIGLSDPFANAFIYAAANLPGNLLR